MINVASGIKYVVDSLSINYSNISAAFSFTSNQVTNTNIVYPDTWTNTASSSGILNTIGGNGFFNYSGTGIFNGNTYFTLNKNYSLNDSTIFISYERLRNEDEILLSSVTGENINNYSGFYIGINNANKLYLKYWNKIEGAFTFVYKNILSDKNLIVINRTDSIITLGHFNNNTFKFELEAFKIFQNNFINSNTLHVGGSPNSFNWGNNGLKNFSGYFDRFYIFNNIPFVYANRIANGLFSEPTGFAGNFVDYCYNTGFLSGSGFSYTGVTGILSSGVTSGINRITGYSNILSGYSYTGITGYQTNIIGSYIDNCGISVNITEQVPLSGSIFTQVPVQIALTGTVFVTNFIDVQLTGRMSGVQNIFVTGSVCDSFFEITGDVLYKYDDQYLSSLGYREISLLSEIKSSSDIIEIYNENYANKTLEYNKDLTYDNLNSNYFYLDREFLPNELLLFGNGQALIDDGYQLIPSGYEIIRSPNLDYFITGITVETNKFFAKKDQLFYDYFTGKFIAYKNTGNLISIPNNIDSNYWVFKNGQKLISGKDYLQNTSQTLSLINTPVTEENYIIFKEYPNYFNYKSGNMGSFFITKNFNHGCSQVYFNGVKQKINNNYIENSNFDLISGDFREPEEFQSIIYNNTDDFFV